MSQRSRSRNIHVARAAAPVLSVIAGSVLVSLPSARADAIWSDSYGNWNVSSNWLSTNGKTVTRAEIDAWSAKVIKTRPYDSDDPEKKEYPMPLYVSDRYNCQVGRLRKDCALENGLCFWVSGDQLLKGAALNAVQIAEELLK